MSSRNRSRRHHRPAQPASRPAEDAPAARDGQVVVGRVIRAHGLDGALRVRSYSDNPARFQPGQTLTVNDAARTIAAWRPLPDGYALLNLDGITGAAAARQLTGKWLYAPTDGAAQLPPGEYYHYQLVGLNVVTDAGENLGQVREILATGSNDVYVVESADGAELLLPAVQQVVKDIDLAAGQILVHLIDGLR